MALEGEHTHPYLPNHLSLTWGAFPRFTLVRWEARLSSQGPLQSPRWASSAFLGTKGGHHWGGFLETESDLASTSYLIAGGRLSLILLLPERGGRGETIASAISQQAGKWLSAIPTSGMKQQRPGCWETSWVSRSLREKKHFFQQDSSDPAEQRERPSGDKLVGGSSNISKTDFHQLTLPSDLHSLS